MLSAEEERAGTVPIVAPAEFVEHSVAENVYAGTAMARRAGYMYGAALPPAPDGSVGAGLGLTTSTGSVGIAIPTVEITETGQRETIDGVEIEFQLAPGTEAPAEMHFYFPGFRALCMAKSATHTLHNLLTLRGALVRDPRIWTRYLTEAIERYADETDVVFASHHWPTWGDAEIREFLGLQRDLYAYLHDQTLRQLNQGKTGVEIAEDFELPPALENAWHARGYYGTVNYNVKAIYQRYMGWFDGNPARLWPHPPEALATRYVEAIGGVDRVVDLAQTAFAAGDFRWAATLLDHAVFADESHAAAHRLYADTLEQLGYLAESGPWRNFYLSGAAELRGGIFGTPTDSSVPEIMAQLTPEQLFDAIAISVNGPRAWDLDVTIDVTFRDLERHFRITLRNGVLVAIEKQPDPATAQATVSLTQPRLLALLAGDAAAPGLDIDGEPEALMSILSVLDPPDRNFAIITP